MQKQIQDELVNYKYQPMPVRKKEIPKDGGTKVRVLSIPAIRDRVVQGALKLILEPIFESRFPTGIVRLPSETVRSDENSAGRIVPLEGWDSITQPEGRGPASVTEVQCR